MNKFKQVVKSLLLDILHIGTYIIYLIIILLGSCMFTATALKIFGVSISTDADLFINFMLNYGIATCIIGWVGFRVHQVYNK